MAQKAILDNKSLDEIDLQPINQEISSLKTAINNISITFSQILANAIYLDTAFNYNDYTAAGLYYINGPYPINASNGPINSNNPTNSYFLVFSHSNNRVTQIILPGNNPNIYWRSKVTDSNTWRDWKTI